MHNELLAQSIQMGGYITIWKLLVFIIVFILWAWIGQWLNKDAKEVNTNRTFWNEIYLAIGTIGLVLWFMLPAGFLVGTLLFLVLWAMTTIIYILHRNVRVPENQTLLTMSHIKWLLSFEERKTKKKSQRLIFISVNNNELPRPYKDEKEYAGYVAAEALLHDMWRRRVSDTVLVPQGENYILRYIIDGIATDEGERSHEEAAECIDYLKKVAGLDVEDHRRPQAGSFFTIRTGEKDTGWRINTSGSTRGEQLRLERIEEKKAIKLSALGFNPDQLARLEETIKIADGVVLVTGPKNSGITTTIYSMIRHHDAFIQNIHSFEKECIMELDNVTQGLLKRGSEASSPARQLQSVLHTDPDVIMVGFCDGPDMAQICTKSARMGKKMYVCMDANSTFQALQEWIKMVTDHKKVAESLRAVINQRLVRILCDECREAYTPDVNMLKKLNLPADKIKQFYRPPSEIEYDKRGNPILCPRCQGTGYYGRTAVFETLFVSDALRKLLEENAPLNMITTQCRKERMLYLQEQALRAVIEGVTSIQEVLRATSK
ncbi:MAG: Flp pilus assembly complex ATPase component TadA [Sedimentisphaerales bacterium]|nr:Flp pilus assembly complex ATPase component TadA [Sedimentisphaerales bacterium]